MDQVYFHCLSLLVIAQYALKKNWQPFTYSPGDRCQHVHTFTFALCVRYLTLN